jgi:TolB-like protein
MTKAILAGAIALGLLAAWPHAQQPPQPPPPATPQQPSDIETTITGEGGAPPRLALPEFIALSPDAETAAIAKTISQVLWDDLNFEREFAFIPRDVYATIPAAKSLDDVPLERWHELNADGVIAGTVQKSGAGFLIRVRIFDVKSTTSDFETASSAERGGVAN